MFGHLYGQKGWLVARDFEMVEPPRDGVFVWHRRPIINEYVVLPEDGTCLYENKAIPLVGCPQECFTPAAQSLPGGVSKGVARWSNGTVLIDIQSAESCENRRTVFHASMH